MKSLELLNEYTYILINVHIFIKIYTRHLKGKYMYAYSFSLSSALELTSLNTSKVHSSTYQSFTVWGNTKHHVSNLSGTLEMPSDSEAESYSLLKGDFYATVLSAPCNSLWKWWGCFKDNQRRTQNSECQKKIGKEFFNMFLLMFWQLPRPTPNLFLFLCNWIFFSN